jgi:malonyl CoA-acyl carrier protein transacylase
MLNCLMFPGQPLAFATSSPADPIFAEIARLTRERASLDLETLAWTREAATEQVRLQVYGVAMSLYQSGLFAQQGVKPAFVAEHSMGIYPALAACGSLDAGDVLELTFRAGVCMAELMRKESYALGCVTGLTLEPLLAIAENNGVHLANLNTSRHFLFSGSAANMTGAMAEALARSAFSAKIFPCDAPLHTPFMEEAALPLAEIFADYRYREPRVPLINHIDQDALTAGEIAGFLVRELCEPVFWERTYLALRRAGTSRFLEAGAGDSLKKYNRWIEHERLT